MPETTFIEQFNQLRKKFPRNPVVGNSNENCDYADNCFSSLNCYYVFDAAQMQDCLYVGDGFKEVRDVDCDFGVQSEDNCECTDFASCNNCYSCQYVTRCYNMIHSRFCVDCHDCFGCTNLTNKQYCIFNIQHTKEEYAQKLTELKKMARTEVESKLAENIKQFPQLHSDYFSNENSEYCDYAYYDTNCYYCFDSTHSQDCGYLTTAHECRDSWDVNASVRVQQSSEVSDSADLYNCYMTTDSARCTDCSFMDYCVDCHDCFGCYGLGFKQFCILNVQYTKEEYFEKIAELKESLGLHFSNSI